MRATTTMKNTERAAVCIAVLVALVVAVTGGSSRPDNMGLILFRPLAAAALVALLFLPRGRWAVGTRLPLIALGLLALLIAMQLIPLPPALWLHLPQGPLVARAAELTGASQPWRPLSLDPMLTLNSLLSLIVPCTALVAVSRLSSGRLDRPGLIVLALAILTALFGIAQFVGGPDSAFYLYNKHFEGAPGGLFSNRNHQAVFLAASLPFLAAWAVEPQRELRQQQQRYVLATLVAMLLVLVLLATASRSGLVIAAPVIVLALAFIAGPVVMRHRLRRWIIAAAAAAVAAFLVLAVLFDRTRGLARFADLNDPSQEMRYRALPTLQMLMREYLPFGSGFGSFNTIFRIAEPDDLLKPTYFNNAHNDYIEMFITAGIPGVLLLLVFLAWIVVRSVQMIRDKASGAERNWPMAAMLCIVSFLLGSVTDYPLRTPLIALVFVLSCAIIELDAARRNKRLTIDRSRSRRTRGRIAHA